MTDDPIGSDYRIVTTHAELDDYLTKDDGKPVGGLDTEATSLDTLKAKMVGVSLSVAENTGIYIPVGHKIGTNVSKKTVVEMLERVFEPRLATMHNAKYDLSILMNNLDWRPKRWEDTLEGPYLDNPDRPELGLKPVCKAEFNMQMEDFEDIFTPEERKAKVFDLSTKTPARCRVYASADADGTRRIWMKYGARLREEHKLPYEVDQLLVEVIREMEDIGGLEVNPDYVDKQLMVLEARAKALKENVFRTAGVEFEIESPKQLGDVLFGRMGLPIQGQTATGQNKTGKEELAKLAEQYPIAEWVVSYKKVVKARDSYFKKLRKLLDTGQKPRFSFNQYAAPTFRLAAPGGSPDRDGKTGINIQAVSNGEERTILGVELRSDKPTKLVDYKGQLASNEILIEDVAAFKVDRLAEEIDLELMHSLPYVLDRMADNDIIAKVCVRDICNGCPLQCERYGMDVTRRQTSQLSVVPSVRQAFMAPKGYVLMAGDYDRQELVIGANLSKEPKWIAALLNGEDLHVITAMAAFNLTPEQWKLLPKNEQKRRRQIGKVLNFATFYGATEHTLSRNTGLPLAQATIVYDGFVKRHPQLFSWMDKVKLFARRHGYTTTYFGRKRWLKDLYARDTKGWKAFADRSAVNTAIQGTGADVIRIAMVKTRKWLKEQQVDPDQARMVMSVHDELMFRIREDLLETVGPPLIRQMMFNVKGWQVQLTVGPKVGTVWGRLEEMPSLMKLAA